MTGELQKQDIKSKAVLLHESVVGILSGRLAVEEAAKRIEEAWEGVGRFAVTQAGITGTFCEGSARWAYASQSAGFSALDVLAETDMGPYELRLSLLDADAPNFLISAPEPYNGYIAV